MSEETNTSDLQAQLDALKEQLAKAEKSKKEALGEKFKLAKDLEDEKAAREAAAEEAERQAGNIAALEKRIADKFQKQIDQLTAERTALDNDLRTIRVDNEISKTLDAQNVLPHMKAPLTALYKTMAQYENGEAAIEGKPLGEYISAHLQGDDGAHYRAASSNSGSSASGNTATTAKDGTFTRENFNLTKFSEVAKTDPAKANAIAAELGLPYKA